MRARLPSSRARRSPTAAWESSTSGDASRLAPASSSKTGPVVPGSVTDRTGRATPGSRPQARLVATTAAPLWPAVTAASARPAATTSGSDADADAGVAAYRGDGCGVHGDALRGGDVRQRGVVRVGPACSAGRGWAGRAHEDELHDVPAGSADPGGDCGDDHLGGVVTAEQVEGDPDASPADTT